MSSTDVTMHSQSKLVIILEHRFLRTPDGQVWTEMAQPYSAWLPYLEIFHNLRIIARIEEVNSVSKEMKPSSGPNVEFFAIPYFIGPLGFLINFAEIRSNMQKYLADEGAILLRVPGTLATVAYNIIKRSRRPYGVQVVGNPFDVFAPGAVRHPLRILFRWWFTRQLKIQCQHATVITYVTRHTLQKLYPSSAKFSNSFSDVQLPPSAFRKPKYIDDSRLGSVHRPCRLVLVGSLAQLYKSPDVLINAISLCKNVGLHLHLTIVGDGRHREELELLASELGVKDSVRFAGHLPAGKAVMDELDQADIFVLPSRTEGLPRALIEAMARGLACIGSTVGGIPELLSQEDLVPPGDALALAQKLQEVILSPDRMVEMSNRNFQSAARYSEIFLSKERQAFFNALANTSIGYKSQR